MNEKAPQSHHASESLDCALTVQLTRCLRLSGLIITTIIIIAMIIIIIVMSRAGAADHGGAAGHDALLPRGGPR
jgi:hypothetical protein